MFRKGLGCCAGYGLKNFDRQFKNYSAYGKMVFSEVIFTLMLQIPTGEPVKMGVEEIEEHDSTFRPGCRQASCDGVFYSKHFASKGGVAFDKSVE